MIRQVLRCTGEVIRAARRDGRRMFAQQVVEDREVVHRQVGDHVDVALEQSEVDAGRVVVVDATEFAALDELAHLAHCAGVDEGVVDEDRQLAPFGFVDQLARLQQGLGHGLFEPQMLARPERSHAQFEMGADRSRDSDRIDCRILKQILKTVRSPYSQDSVVGPIPIFLVSRSATAATAVPGVSAEVSDQVGSPVAIADDTDVYHVSVATPFVLER